jgi:hypothetical protein
MEGYTRPTSRSLSALFADAKSDTWQKIPHDSSAMVCLSVSLRGNHASWFSRLVFLLPQFLSAPGIVPPGRFICFSKGFFHTDQTKKQEQKGSTK